MGDPPPLEPASKRRKLSDVRAYANHAQPPAHPSIAELIVNKYANLLYFGTRESRDYDEMRLGLSHLYTPDLHKRLCQILVDRFQVIVGSKIKFREYKMQRIRYRQLTEVSTDGRSIRFAFADLAGFYEFHEPHCLLDNRDAALYLWIALKLHYRTRSIFLLALHPRLGRNSPVYRFTQGVLYDPNLMRALLRAFQ